MTSLLADTGVHVPPLAVRVKIAVPVKSAGGVHVAFKEFASGEKVPPEVVDQAALVASPTMTPPKPDVVLPWQIVSFGPTVTHCCADNLPENTVKINNRLIAAFFMLLRFQTSGEFWSGECDLGLFWSCLRPVSHKGGDQQDGAEYTC